MKAIGVVRKVRILGYNDNLQGQWPADYISMAANLGMLDDITKKKYKASLLRCKEWIRDNRTMPIKQLMKKLTSKLQGHCNYYGVTGNRRAVGNFIDEVRSLRLLDP